MFRRPALVLVVLALLGGCTGSSKPAGTTVTTPSDTLADLAADGAAASYHATYEFHQATPDTTATVQVWRADPSLRVDVVSGRSTATLLVTPAGSYSCSITGARRSCLLVAAAGQPLPKPFDVAPANLFTATLRELAAHTAMYDVRSAPAMPAAGTVPAARCFEVALQSTAAPSPSPSAVPPGRYCLTSTGLLAAATYPSGNTVRLTAVAMVTPAPGELTPYAKPTPLPS